MSCEYCGGLGNLHDYRCPNYSRPKANYKCCYCGSGICSGEEYIVNYDGEYIHRDCIPCIDFLIDWLGYETKEMEDIDED